MKFVPAQSFIQHVLTQKYKFSMLDWFGGVFHQTSINFRWFRTFARLNSNSNFLMCFRILNFVSITNIYFGWGRHKTKYYSSNEQDTPIWQGKPSKVIWKKRILQKRSKKRRKRRGTLQKDQIKRREGLSQVHEVKYDLKPGINS